MLTPQDTTVRVLARGLDDESAGHRDGVGEALVQPTQVAVCDETGATRPSQSSTVRLATEKGQ